MRETYVNEYGIINFTKDGVIAKFEDLLSYSCVTGIILKDTLILEDGIYSFMDLSEWEGQFGFIGYVKIK
ncbi:hypothetical protein [Clostridium tagluense]|uniref:Uncharacterized protein n=1 Tax=Clostridium tagluense TaxID=360422 RepID=A0A401UTK1_9CLOT|nr:hypothetical protein [Clostridium tagluense]GCD12873.1 hypothetical protein Ctaglu_44960 [Clostridium tagluense]